jgi:hypothetical protein
MEKLIIIIFMASFIISGCAPNKIAIMSVEGRNDVFQNAAYNEQVPVGFAVLTIVSTLKIRESGGFLWSKPPHGTPEQSLLLNIDGQITRVRGDLTKEQTKSGEPWNPEAGKGIRYFFEEKLRLKPGRHRVFAALPQNEVYFDREIAIREDTDNILELAPVYGKRKVGRLPDINAETSFYEGIRGFRGYLNGKEI